MSNADDYDETDAIPRGICTAPGCRCQCFRPNFEAHSPMYCAKKNCWHSVEWHHLNSREVGA